LNVCCRQGSNKRSRLRPALHSRRGRRRGRRFGRRRVLAICRCLAGRCCRRAPRPTRPAQSRRPRAGRRVPSGPRPRPGPRLPTARALAVVRPRPTHAGRRRACLARWPASRPRRARPPRGPRHPALLARRHPASEAHRLALWIPKPSHITACRPGNGTLVKRAERLVEWRARPGPRARRATPLYDPGPPPGSRQRAAQSRLPRPEARRARALESAAWRPIRPGAAPGLARR
jgi:hypothetical protein